MATVRGMDVLVSIKSGLEYVVVGGQRGATLNRSSEAIDVTNKVNGGWKENVAGFKEWSVDCDGLYVVDDAGYAALEAAFNTSDEVELKIASGSLVYVGKAIITDFPIEAPYDDIATYSISFTGTGALADTEA